MKLILNIGNTLTLVLILAQGSSVECTNEQSKGTCKKENKQL